MQLTGKVALVTGAQQGIGRAMAREFAAAGADVAINWLDDEGAAQRVAGEVRTCGRHALLVEADVSRLEQVQAMVSATQEGLGPIDVLINNAGVFPRVPFLEMTEHDWDQVLDVNLKGSCFCAQYVAKAMVVARRQGSIINMASGIVSMQIGARGPNFSVVSACATGGHAVGEAARIIQHGGADAMICGGSEAAITPLSLAGFCNMKALSLRNDEPARASRPFDLERDGFVMGEGAGVVVLEAWEHAERRGARIYAELAGYGMSADAYHITMPDPEGDGAVLAMQMALDDAGIEPAQVGYINAHGTSTQYNDKFETLAIKRVFGAWAPRIPVSSTKSMTAHLLGAAGGVELIACALAIERGMLPPTINYEVPDPECDLDYVPNVPRAARVDVAMSNAFGFGGHNGILVARRPS